MPVAGSSGSVPPTECTAPVGQFSGGRTTRIVSSSGEGCHPSLMEIVTMGRADGHPIDKFGSSGAFHRPVAHTEGDSALGLITLQADGVLGRHPAVGDQLFIVIDGEGWVAGEDDTRINIKAGQAALWRAGESHESGTPTGMTALVVEARMVRPG